MRPLTRCAIGLATALLAVIPVVAHQQTDMPGLTMAAGPGRQPVALILKNSDTLGDSLRTRGIATLQYETSDVSAAVAAITALRNNSRIVSVTVIGPAEIAWASAQIARADAVIATDGAATTLGSQVIQRRDIAGASDANAIASFITGLKLIRHPSTQRASPRATVVAMLGSARISIEYGRPSKRGRAIWGALVPWDRWWMPGADEATVMTNTEPMTIGDLKLPAGEHTLYTMPSETDFALIVNSGVGQFHTEYRPSLDLGRVRMTSGPDPNNTEQMMFSVEASGNRGTLTLSWGDRRYSTPIGVGQSSHVTPGPA